MGTGSTLALLPAENATGNFVKVVQRLPVRIELTNYDPDVAPLFIGLSVTPYVYIHETPTGPNPGKMLQAQYPRLIPFLRPAFNECCSAPSSAREAIGQSLADSVCCGNPDLYGGSGYRNRECFLALHCRRFVGCQC
jgi:hypothetical protein